MNISNKLLRSQLELTKPIADGTSLDVARSFQDKIGKLMHFTKRHDVVASASLHQGSVLCCSQS